jgi:DNA-binding transcriptional LysR family regulator
MMRGHTTAGQDVIEFAVPHTLAFTFFPAWVSGLRENFGPIKSRLIALNVHDAVMRLVEGSCDLLIAYHHPSQPYQLDADRYEMVSLGEESLAPYVQPNAHGAPRFLLPGKVGHPLPYLGYAPGAYLGQMVDLILKQSSAAIHFDRMYETDMAEGLKAMALEGHGIAFLPYSAVKKDLHSKKLVSALPADLHKLQITMEVRAYRERPSTKEPGKSGVHTNRSAGPSPKRNAQTLWDYLLTQTAVTATL